MTRSLIFAWLVHLDTHSAPSSVSLAFLLSIKGLSRVPFFLMGIAVVLDATDGTLARLARVKEVLPRFDGTLLDEIVDYFNYVIVPCFFLFRANLLPPADALWLAILPLLASAYGFCEMNAKTADNFFLGFPSYWTSWFFILTCPDTEMDQCFRNSRLMCFSFRSDQIYLSKSQPAISFPDQFLGSLWGAAIFYIVYRLPEPSTRLAMTSLLFPGLLYRTITVA